MPQVLSELASIWNQSQGAIGVALATGYSFGDAVRLLDAVRVGFAEKALRGYTDISGAMLKGR